MRADAIPTHAILDAWREQGADRVDPLAFQYLAALHRRVDRLDGEPRRALENRLAASVETYADNLKRTTTGAADEGRADRSPLPTATAQAMLRNLTDELASRAAVRSAGSTADAIEPRSGSPEPTVLDEVRKIWDSVRTDSQMRRSLEPSPTDAGPLNSSRLVHRALTLMHELSPDYLQQFLSYIDALSWLQQMSDSGALGTKDASRHDNGKAHPSHTPRKRRR